MMFCQTFSHLRDGQNSREARDKGNVSQQLRTTNTNAEPMRKASESDAAENVSLPGDATNSLSPAAQSRDPPAKDTLTDTVHINRLPGAVGVGFSVGLHWDFRKLWPRLWLG